MTEPWMLLPSPWQEAIAAEADSVRAGLEEVRFRVGQPVVLYGSFGWRVLEGERVSSAEYLENLLLRLVDHSLYARLDEIRQGYISLPGGHRVGIAGRAVMNGQQVETVRDVSGLNIRRARADLTPASAVLAKLDASGDPLSVLVASPPRGGKTTLIRELARHWSDAGHVTVVVDERGEIAGSVRGRPSYSVGRHSDVLDGWPKAEGMLAALRSLSPELLVVDELALPEDFEAVWKARWAGVRVLASVHLGALACLRQHAEMYRLWEAGVFDALVLLSRRTGPGTVEAVERWAIGEADS